MTFWGEALASLVHIWNRCPTDAVGGATPFELWHGHKPDVSHLRVWDCPAYVHVQKDKRSAFGSHFEKCIFIGYPDGYKAWKFYNLKTKCTMISEHADFDEHGSVPHPPPFSTSTSPSLYVPPLLPDGLDPEEPHLHVPGGDLADQHAPAPEAPPVMPPKDLAPVPHVIQAPASPVGIGARLPNRQHNPPKEWWKLSSTQINSHADEEDEEDAAMAFSTGTQTLPRSYCDATHREDAAQWQQAAVDELGIHLQTKESSCSRI